MKLEADYKAAAHEEETLAKYLENSHVLDRSFKSDIRVKISKLKNTKKAMSYQMLKQNIKLKCNIKSHAAEWKMPKSNVQNPELIPVQPGYNFEVQKKMIDVVSMPKTSLKQFDSLIE